MTKITLAAVLAAACAMNAFAHGRTLSVSTGDSRALTTPAISMPPICWILPTVSCR